MVTLFKTIHLSAAVFLILVVLLQSGRGGGMGAALSGATGQIFGGRGANTFLTRLTSITAAIFFCTSLTLSMMSSRHHSVVRSQGPDTARTLDTDGAPSDDPAADADHVDAAPADTATSEPSAPGAPAPTPPGVPEGAAKP